MESGFLNRLEVELTTAEIVLTKETAAREQLHTAIELFFHDGSHVSQHTLIAAAHGVLRDVAAASGIKKSFKDSLAISEAERVSFIKAVNYPQNFFKHAKDDPKGMMAFRYKLVPIFLLDALVLWASLGYEISSHMKVFLMWIQLEFPELLTQPEAEIHLQQIRANTSDPNDYKKIGRELLRQGLG